MANKLPMQDIEAQLPLELPDSSPKFPKSCKNRRHSFETSISASAALPESRRPSVINQPFPANPSTEKDGAPTSPPRHPWWQPIKRPVVQMIIAAALAVVIGIVVAATADEVPDAARALLAIPGDIWLRALKCIVVPLILSSVILAVQRLKQMSGHGALISKWTLSYYLSFMILAIVQSTTIASLVWSRLFVRVESSVANSNDANSTIAASGTNTTQVPPHEVMVQVFESLIPENIVEAIAADQRLLSVMVIALVIGYLLRPASIFVKVVKEVEELVAAAVVFLIRLAPIGVFFLILPNLFILPLRDIGTNLGVLIGASLMGMFIHLFIGISMFYLVVVRENPYAFLLRIAPAWMEAWGSGSSAATLPVTMECVIHQKVPLLVTKFVVPLGVLINMDGTALYFPVAVTFMAVTQGILLSAGDYVVIALLSTLSTIGASPIPGSALVFVVMICNAVHVPISSMYAVIVAIDWFIDRFRTALNASGDAFAAKVIAKVTGIHDGEHCDDVASAFGERLCERMIDGDHGRPLRRIGSTLTI